MKTDDKTKTPPDVELVAIRRILGIVDGLPDEQARARVMLYVSQRVYPNHGIRITPAVANGAQAG